jgi:cell division protease FtsH
MSEKLGPRVFGHDHGQPFLGREFSSEPDYSDEIAREIDDEIRRMVEEAHQAARDILEEHRDKLDVTSEILLRRETIEREQFIELLEGKAEDEVFGAVDTPVPLPPPATPEAPERKPERAPKGLPRPGLAGGTAEMHGEGSPEKPEPA